MKWIYANSGVIRLIEISIEDTFGVSALAAQHGLRFGAAVSHGVLSEDKAHSYGVFYRSDREFSDDELVLLKARVLFLHHSSLAESRRPSILQADHRPG